MFGQRIFKRLAKALIRLRICTGWSEPLLVANTALLEILCRGSYVLRVRKLSAKLGLLIDRSEKRISNSYTMACPHVRGDVNPRA